MSGSLYTVDVPSRSRQTETRKSESREIDRRQPNRGPAAAAANRSAILVAARGLFAQRGYHVPLNAIAREAGVGQGVLYRHFPTRLALAFAVFEENFAELEALAQQPTQDTFARLWARLVELMQEASAFIEMVVDARRTLPAGGPTHEADARLAALLEAALVPARSAGVVSPTLGPADVQLALRMMHGVVVTSPDPDSARAAVRDALALLPAWARQVS